MENYSLKTKNGEKIKTIKAINIGEAIEKFAKIKVLPIDELLKIFRIDVA